MKTYDSDLRTVFMLHVELVVSVMAGGGPTQPSTDVYGLHTVKTDGAGHITRCLTRQALSHSLIELELDLVYIQGQGSIYNRCGRGRHALLVVAVEMQHSWWLPKCQNDEDVEGDSE